MIIYVPNDDVAPILSYLRRCSVTVKPTPEEIASLARMEKSIVFEKTCKPYQMYLSNKEERHVEDSVAGAGRVDARRTAGGNRVRKNRAQKRRR